MAEVIPILEVFVSLSLSLSLVSRDTVSLCSFGAYPGTQSIDQAVLELTEIGLPLPPKCWEEDVSVPSVYMSVFVPVPYCFYYYGSVI